MATSGMSYDSSFVIRSVIVAVIAAVTGSEGLAVSVAVCQREN